MNDTPLNEYFQEFTYASSFSFLLTLSGPALDSPNGTSTSGTRFGVGLYDDAQTPILTDQGADTGFAGQIDINLDGTTTPTAFPTATGGPSVVSFATVPEPRTLPLVVLGAVGLATLIKKARQANCS